MPLSWLANREYNEKCVAIAGLAVVGYYTLPPRRLWVGVGLAIGVYAGIAWYDALYGCSERLVARGGLFGAVSGPFKPPVVEGVYGGGMATTTAPC